MKNWIYLLGIILTISGCAKLQPNAENQGQPAGSQTTPSSSSAKNITYFAFPLIPAIGTISGSNITVAVPSGTSLSALRAVVLIDGVSLSLAGVNQVSGVTQNDFSNPVTYMVTAQDGSTRNYIVTVTASTALKDILYFNFPNIGGVYAITGTNINVSVPYGTNLTNLVAAFLTNGNNVRVGATVQTSGVTANDFSTAKTYVVTAQDASTQSYTITVTADLATKEILSYSAGGYAGRISGTSITIDVPYGTNVINFTPVFQHNGISVKISNVAQTSGVTTADLSTPKIYTVTAYDGTTKDYTVTANIGLNTSKEITAFSIPSLNAVGLIQGTTITVNVPNGTNVTNLVPAFSTTGNSVKIGATTQVTGLTANNFSSALTYTVTAADSSTQTYTVSVVPGSVSDSSVAAFTFSAAGVTGSLGGNNITATVPYGTNIANLVATFSSTGVTVKVNGVTQTSGVTPNNFTNSVVYTVIAADGTITTYTVSVSVAQPSSNANILYFTMTTTADFGIFSGNNIAVRVPTGTNLTTLVPIFKSNGNLVKVNGLTQFSGVTVNDFSSPVSYTVIAQDGTTKTYTVTVTIVAYDVFAPQITSVTAIPNSTGTYPATVTIRVYYTETGSGISTMGGYGLNLCSPTRMATGSGGTTLGVSSLTNQGAYLEGTVTLQNYHESGIWKVCYVWLQDLAGNGRTYSASSFVSTTNYATTVGTSSVDSGVPIGGAVSVTGTTQDTTAPTISSVTAIPNSTGTYPATVTIRVYYTETGSGISTMGGYGLNLCSPTRMATGSGGTTLGVSSLTNQGAYLEGTVTLQNYHESGIWKVCYVWLQDLAGNGRTYSASSFVSTTNYATTVGTSSVDSGVPIGGAVSVTGTTQDTTAPTISSVTATPSSTGTYPATVTIRVYYTETGSGISTMGGYGLNLCSPTRMATGLGGTTLGVSSLTNQGAYLEGTVTLQNYHESGIWKVCYVWLQDLAGNGRTYSASSFVSTTNYATTVGTSSVDSGVPIGGAVSVTGTTQDTTAPTISSVTATPSSTGTYPATVTIRVYYTETGSGISTMGGYGLNLCSPTRMATGSGGTTLGVSSLTNQGAYLEGTVTLQNYHESGIWKVCYVWLQDLAGNGRTYSASSFVSTTNYATTVGTSSVDSGVPIGGAVDKQ